MEIDIIPAAGNLVVRRLKNADSGGIMSPGDVKGTECVIVATSEESDRFRPGVRVYVARSVGVPVGGDEDDDLWFVGIDDVLGWKKEGAS